MSDEYNIPVLVKAWQSNMIASHRHMQGEVILCSPERIAAAGEYLSERDGRKYWWSTEHIIPHPTAAQVREEATKAGKPIPPEYQESSEANMKLIEIAVEYGITPEAARAALEKAREEESVIEVGDVVTWRGVTTFETKFVTPKFATDYQDNDWTVSDCTKVIHPEVIAYVKGLRK